MKRYHEEKHFAEQQAKLRRRLNASFDTWFTSQPGKTQTEQFGSGRFRKSLRCSGCGRARCQVCHPEKFPKRIPTRKELQANADLTEQQKEL